MNKEIPDIAMWEETDSELAKYKIQALNSLVNSYKKQNEFFEASIKHIEQVNTNLYKRIDKAIEYCEDITSREIDISDTDYDLGEDSVARDILDILRGENNE